MLDDVVCNLCKESTPEEDFLLCDGCSRGEHADCCGLAALPARFYFCTRCQSQGHTIKGMIIQELVAAEPDVLTYNELGTRVAARRLHLQGDMVVTKKSVSAELTRMSNGEIGVRDDGQPLLQRYPDESGVLLYYLTPDECTSHQPLSPSAASVHEQPLLLTPMADQVHTPWPNSGPQLAVLDMPGADMADDNAPGRSPSPRLADSQPRTNATRHCTASQTRDKPQAHAAQRGHTARQQRRPRKPDPPYPEAYYEADISLSPVHRSASSPEGDDTAPMQTPVRPIQPARVQTPAQTTKSLRSQMRRLLSASSPGDVGHPSQDQNNTSKGLQSRLGPAMPQAARTAHAQSTQEVPSHAPALPTSPAAHAQVSGCLSAAAEVPCTVVASQSHTQDRPEDRVLEPSALAPLQTYDAVHKSTTDLPFNTFSEFLRQSSDAPSNHDHGGDVMLEEAAITSPSSMLRDDSPPTHNGRGLPHPQTITDLEDNNMVHEQNPPAGYSPCGTSSLPEATPEPQGSHTVPADAQQSPPAHLNTASQAMSPHPGHCNQVMLPLQTNLQGPTAQQHTAILPLSTVIIEDSVQHPPQPEAITQQPASANQPVASEGMVQGDVGTEGIPPPHLLLQSGYTGSKPISQPSDSLHDSGLDVGAIATLPPLSASVQTQSAPQSPRQADSASHATGKAASHATGQATSGQHHRAVTQHGVVLSQADIMQQVAQWTDNRPCTVMYSNGVLQIQQVPGSEAADSAVGAVDGAETPRWHPCAYMCARASPLAHGTAMGPQAVKPPHGQPITQRKRKRDSDVSASSKRQRACRRLHASLRTISCVMIAMWLYPYLTGS